MKKLITWSVYILSTCIITAFLYKVDPSSPFEAFFAACFVSVGPALIVLCIYQLKWRHDNGVDLFATLETDKRKLKKHMLFIMQYHGIEENLKELNDIFRNYPQWELHKWEVFRAWYKAQIDHMVLHPDIYGLSLNGEPYKKENDPLYDPSAPDWALYDRDHYYDDDDDDFDDDDDEDYGKEDKKNKFSDAFAIGMGIGIVNSLTCGSVFGGGSGGN